MPEIAKIDEDRRLVFGWQSVVVDKSGAQVEDTQGDLIDPGELENAVYEFVLHERKGGEMHKRTENGAPVVVASLVESIVFTNEKCAALGIPEGTMPEGWWAGWRVHDDAAWEGVKSGKYRAFSIGGEAERVPAEVS